MASYFGFGKIVVPGQPSIISNGYSSQLNFLPGNNIVITTNPNTNTVTFSSNASGSANPAGPNNSVQFNNGNVMGGSGSFTYNPANNLVTLGNLTSNGNVNFSNSSAINLGPVGNLKISGGSNGYVLSTDGAGNLHWASSVVTPGGSNKSVQFNNNGSLAGSSNFTYDNGNQKLYSPNITTDIFIVTQSSNLTNIITNNLSSSGNISGANIIGNHFGNGASLTSLTGANVTGQVSHAAIANSVAGANVVGTVASATHANVSDLANSVNVSNVIGLGNLAVVNLTGSSTSVLFGNGTFAPLSSAPSSNFANYAGNAFSVAGANVTGQVNYAAVANSVAGSNVTGQVNYAGVANSVAGANVTGQVNYAAIANRVDSGNIIGQVSNASIAGSVYSNSQPNITSVGTLTSLRVNGTANLSSLSVTGNSNLGSVSNLKITGGSSGQYLQTDGTGNLIWANSSGGNGNSNAAGVNTSVQFNSNGVFAGTANFTYNASTSQLSVQNISAGNLSISGNINAANLTVSNKIIAGQLQGDGGNISNINGANVVGTVSNSNSANTAITITGNNQPNITNVGTLSNLSVSGNATVNNLNATGNITAGGNAQVGSLVVNGVTSLGNLGNVTISGGNAGYVLATDGYGNLSWTTPSYNRAQGPNTSVQLNISNNLTGYANFTYDPTTSTVTTTKLVTTTQVNFSAANVVNLGSVSGITITGGVNGYFLQTDGTGNLTWSAAGGGGGGSGTPGGANMQVQFNDGGNFNGVSGFQFNKVTGALTATSFIGSGNNLSGIQGANVIGFVPGANIANTANYANYSNIANTANTVIGQVSNALVAATVYMNAQPNITSVGTLASLSVSGNANTGNIGALSGTFIGNVKVGAGTGGNISGANIITSNNFIGGNINASNLILSGNLQVANTSQVNLGNLANLTITGGGAGNVLTTYGNGALFWGPGGGGGGGLQSRSNASVTTSILMPGQSFNANVYVAKSFGLYTITTSVGAWVTVYSSMAARTADANRTIGTDPTPGSGVLAEIVSTGNTTYTQLLTPPAMCFSSESSPTPITPMRIAQNAGDGSNYPVTVNITYLPLE